MAFDMEETIQFLYRSMKNDPDAFAKKVQAVLLKHSHNTSDIFVKDVNEVLPDARTCIWLDYLPECADTFSTIEWTCTIGKDELYLDAAYDAIPVMFIRDQCKGLAERFTVAAVVFNRTIHPLPVLWDEEQNHFITYDQLGILVERRFDQIFETEEFRYLQGSENPDSISEEDGEYDDFVEEFMVDLNVDAFVAALQEDTEAAIRRENVKEQKKARTNEGRDL